MNRREFIVHLSRYKKGVAVFLCFVIPLHCRLYVAPIQTRLIVASFGHDAQYLNGQAFRDWNAGRSIRIERLIEDLEGLHNRTNLDEGLELAFDVYGRKEIKERNFAPNVMIVFTDGKTFDREQVFKVWKTKVRKASKGAERVNVSLFK